MATHDGTGGIEKADGTGRAEDGAEEGWVKVERKDCVGEGDVKNKAEAKQLSSKDQKVIVVAGKPRSGKSRALNNIFPVKFDSKVSAKSVTKHLVISRVLKEGKQLIVIDTPGIGASDIPLKDVKKEFEELVGGLSFTLLLCHSVGPGNIVQEADRVVLKNLKQICGSNVWKKCVVLFTFSDTLRDQEYSSEGDRVEYLDMLRGHAREFEKMLKKVFGSSVSSVKIFLDVDTRSDNIDEIAAVPVGLAYKDKKEKHFLLPNDEFMKDWRKRAYFEILRKSTPLERETLLTITHGAVSVSNVLAGIAAGALVGLCTGAIVGLLAGGLPAIPAGAAGAAAGALAGGVGAAGSTSGLMLNTTRVREKRAKKLSEGEFTGSPEQQQEQGQTQAKSPSPCSEEADHTAKADPDSERSPRTRHTHPTHRKLQKTPTPVISPELIPGSSRPTEGDS